MKFAPLTVRMKAPLPAAADDGLMPLTAGGGLLIEKTCVPEVPPPGVGLTTVTSAVPWVVRSEPGTRATRSVELPKPVASGLPFHWAVEVETKFVPVSVRVTAGVPTMADVGAIDVRVGAGLLIVNVWAFDGP